MQALVVSNMRPDAAHPGRGSFVRDQVSALRRLEGLEVELFEFGPGPRAMLGAAAQLRRRYRGRRLDVVHAHFGLSAWPALAVAAERRLVTLHGTDARHPRTRRLTRPVLRRMSLTAAVSASLAAEVQAWAPAPVTVLPCGVDLARFRPIARSRARTELGLDAAREFVFFPADPARPGKRHDLALRAAREVPLLSAGDVAPARMPLWINAASAVLVPSDAEGFGLSVLEALACDVPVLATPVGVHPLVLEGIAGTLCAPYDERRWHEALAQHLGRADPRVAGRDRARLFSAERMAERVAVAWRATG